MRAKTLLFAATLVPSLAFAWPWSTDMVDQPSVKPQEIEEQRGEMRAFPKRSIPVQGIPTKVANRDEAKSLKSPVAATNDSINRGRNLFKIYCAACHGLTGKADSPVSGKIGAISLVDDYVQTQLTEGWVFGTITFGSYVMPAYGAPARRDDGRGSNDLNVEERWDVVNYVKHGLVKDSQAPTRTAAVESQAQ